MKTPGVFYGFLVLAVTCVIAGAMVSDPGIQFFYGFSAILTSFLAFASSESKH